MKSGLKSLPAILLAIMTINACAKSSCPLPGEQRIFPGSENPQEIVPFEREGDHFWIGPPSLSFYETNEPIEAQSGILFVRLDGSVSDEDFENELRRLMMMLSRNNATIVGQHQQRLEIQVFIHYESCVVPLYNKFIKDPFIIGLRFNLPSIQENR
ncbi:MAG: hypothetical protein JJT96_18295 [Opitutales bacterium]|nr:hypothetical protein [Opitutales bacterium]